MNVDKHARVRNSSIARTSTAGDEQHTAASCLICPPLLSCLGRRRQSNASRGTHVALGGLMYLVPTYLYLGERVSIYLRILQVLHGPLHPAPPACMLDVLRMCSVPTCGEWAAQLRLHAAAAQVPSKITHPATAPGVGLACSKKRVLATWPARPAAWALRRIARSFLCRLYQCPAAKRRWFAPDQVQLTICMHDVGLPAATNDPLTAGVPGSSLAPVARER